GRPGRRPRRPVVPSVHWRRAAARRGTVGLGPHLAGADEAFRQGGLASQQVSRLSLLIEQVGLPQLDKTLQVRLPALFQLLSGHEGRTGRPLLVSPKASRGSTQSQIPVPSGSCSLAPSRSQSACQFRSTQRPKPCTSVGGTAPGPPSALEQSGSR